VILTKNIKTYLLSTFRKLKETYGFVVQHFETITYLSEKASKSDMMLD
jgi:hypothetical protein